MTNMEQVSGKTRMMCNGYYQYYWPEHHLANNTGTVSEHTLVAEDMLGRPLKRGEVVHHKDKHRTNNSYDNLMVFKTLGDHTAYHNGCDIKLDGDVYVAIRKENTICPICGKEKSTRSRICIDCYNAYQARNIPPREAIYNLLKDKNMCEIGRIYNVCDNTVRKWCKKYGLPYSKKEIEKFREEEFGIVKIVKKKHKPSLPHPVDMMSLDDRVLMNFTSLSKAAKYIDENNLGHGGLTGIAHHISRVCKGKGHVAYGHKWRYAV